MDDQNSTKYDVKEIDDDPRFIVCWREFKFLNISSLLITGIAIFVCYALGSDPDRITFIWGYPAWYFWASAILTAGAVFYCIWFARFFKMPSLAPREESDANSGQGEEES